MPGSGPIDPDKILQIIATASHDEDHLETPDGARWLRVDGSAWEESSVLDVRISRETFDDLAGCTPELPLVRVDGALKRLDSVDGWAVLNPA